MTPKASSPAKTASPQLDLLFDASLLAEEATPKAAPRRDRTRRTWLVHQLVTEARDLVEQELGDVWVEGEISNLRPASSGHLYFTLKDADAQLPVVLFRRQANLLRFRPEDGLHVRVRGKVTIYEQRGQLQLVAETLEPVGAGSLQLAFEQLRDRLKAEGLFDLERKQPLPAFPRTVAIITSPTGAVIRDFLNIVNRRHSALSVLLIPAAVQGDNAVGEVVAAIELANASGIADLIVLARGGGSLEDLAAFNSERVARAIAASELPVVSAIGHETDFTIADFAADLRAPTPSAAAELVTEAQHRIEELLASLSNRLVRGARFQILQARQRFARVSVANAQQRVTANLHRLEQRLDDLSFSQQSSVGNGLRLRQRRVAELTAAVLRHDPRRHLSAARESLAASESRLLHVLDRQLAGARFQNQSLHGRLLRAAHVAIAQQRSAFHIARNQLQSLSPVAVLQRGYAIVQDESGALIRSVAQLNPGQSVQTRMGDGSFTSSVTQIQNKKKDKKPSR